MAGTSSVGGLASGLDTNSIISQLIELERIPITNLETRKTKLNAKLSAWQEANTRILALKDKMTALSLGTSFNARTLTSSDETIVKGTVTSSAEVGTYYVTVNSVARSHQIRTDGDGYTDTTATRLGTGTLSISVGTGAAKNITVDDSNNTLTGLRDAINRSGAGVKATIVNDGTTDTPYHLVLTSNTGGSAGQITIGSTGTIPTFNTVVQTAENASVTMGEGAGAITVQSSTNEVAGLIPGVTLNLQSKDIAKTVAVTVGEDTAPANQAIKDFVTQYNNLVDFIDKQFKFDANTKATGTLFGDASLRAIQADLNNKLFGKPEGLNQDICLLSQLGITTSVGSNKLTIDETKLGEALSDHLGEVKGLFTTIGDATSSSVSLISATDKTIANGATYAVEITAVATQARVTAGVAQTEALLTDEQLTINGQTIDLTAGMTQDQVISEINESSTTTGIVASRTDINGQGVGNYLTLTRTAHGSAQTISGISTVSNGSTATSGFGNVLVTLTSTGGEAGTGTGAVGIDVAGTINGEAATGIGQTLTGNSGNANTDGLKLRITASAPGSYGTITVTKGIGTQMAEYLDFVTWTGTGAVKTSQSSLQSMIDDIAKTIVTMESRVASKKERLVVQFAQMESALARLQSQSSQLASQIAGLSF